MILKTGSVFTSQVEGRETEEKKKHMLTLPILDTGVEARAQIKYYFTQGWVTLLLLLFQVPFA